MLAVEHEVPVVVVSLLGAGDPRGPAGEGVETDDAPVVGPFDGCRDELGSVFPVAQCSALSDSSGFDYPSEQGDEQLYGRDHPQTQEDGVDRGLGPHATDVGKQADQIIVDPAAADDEYHQQQYDVQVGQFRYRIGDRMVHVCLQMLSVC